MMHAPDQYTEEDPLIPNVADSIALKAQYKPKATKKALDSQPKKKGPGCFKRFIACFASAPETRPRRITFDAKPQITPTNRKKNVVDNTKYSIITFIPLVLYNEFKYFSNTFFLVTALSQFYEPMKVGYMFTYVGPLVFVLVLTMLKEMFDDLSRYRKDRQANSTKYKLMTFEGFKPVPSSRLRVGDIIQIEGGQRIPADCILLHSSEPSGSIFLKTDQLDGETDWKVRKAVMFTQKYYSEHNTLKDIKGASITANPPNVNIYEFAGLFEKDPGPGTDAEAIKEALGLENTMWGSTVLTTGKVVAMVIYTGLEMRIVMNSRSPRTKIGKLDLEVNYLCKLLFILLLSLAIMLVALDRFEGKWYLNIARFMILLCAIVPISLRVNLDFAKLVYSWQIAHDKDIEDTVVRNSAIPEELGRIQFLLTDKTGTLTQNEMIFKKLSFEFGTYEQGMIGDIKGILKNQCKKYDGPLADYSARFDKVEEADTSKKLFKRDKETIVRDVVSAMCLCHNVTPVIENGKKIYQGSSPDEIALVQIAEMMGYNVDYRDESTISITNITGKKEDYKVLANFPFSSSTKRMGIILQHFQSGRYIFYLKGADTVMKDRVRDKQKGFLMDECEVLAREGLRTLAFSQKYLLPSEYQAWRIKYDEATQVLVNREERIQEVISSLEKSMEFLCVTGVEDKLQDDVCATLETLRNAGIKVWMLTGDKVETGICIAISAGIKSSSQSLHVMKELTDPFEVNHQLHKFAGTPNCVLVIDGATLSVAMESLEETFFSIACKAPAVVCCRCSPTQKAQIAEAIKRITAFKVCCIGDGGNDVGMIQASDIGIGIEGKEGKQAALAADYSILKFNCLNKLFLWHGRLAYKRSAMLAQFVFHRGLIISLIQVYFSVIFYYVSLSIYSGLLLLGYCTIYTIFPIFSLIFDEDIDLERALIYPPLYKTLQRGRALNQKTFFSWVFQSVYQASVILILGVYLFTDSYLKIVTITFSALIISEYLNILTEVYKVTKVMVVSIILSMLTYLASCIFLRNLIDISSIDGLFASKILLLTMISWVPVWFFRFIKDYIDPSDHEIIMRSAKKAVPKGDVSDSNHNQIHLGFD